jgi:NADPH-dependent curcumin reductase
MKTQQWRMKHRTAVLDVDDFEKTGVELPAPGTGQLLAKVLMFALDPYLARSMQTWVGETSAWGDGTIHGRVLAQVVTTQAEGFAPGDLIAGLGRWQECELFEAKRVQRISADITPPSLSMSVLSGSGLTAWVGLNAAHLSAGQPSSSLRPPGGSAAWPDSSPVSAAPGWWDSPAGPTSAAT